VDAAVSRLTRNVENKRWLLICLILFSVAAGVRFLVWQNNKVAMSGVQYVVVEGYLRDAQLLIDGNIAEFVRGPDPPSNANILLHPPGYPIFLAAIDQTVGSGSIEIVQILTNSVSAILVFLIAATLFDTPTGTVTGTLTALSPQFAYYSGIVLPDELSTLPILAAVYFLIRAINKPDLKWSVLCGAAIGLSCWLRANALLLPLFVAGAAMLVFPKGTRLRFAAAILISFVVSISPITIRNYVVFDSFLPLSLGTGTTFIEGLGDMDSRGSRGLPTRDEQVMSLDADRFDRPDYYGFLYSPDGIFRDRERIKFGLGVVASEPLWFLAGSAKRGLDATFRMERVPVIASERDEAETTNPIIHALNRPLKMFQRVFTTAVFLPLIIVGAILIVWKRREWRKVILLAAIPFYYMSVQALIHTEYRYMLPAAHLLIIFAAVTIAYLWVPLKGAVLARFKPR